MDTEQARNIATAHDNFDGALANLRNAVAMPTDDPRSKELLEAASDSYWGAAYELEELKAAAINSHLREMHSQVSPKPKFALGEIVLVDEGPSGPCEIRKITGGMVPKVEDDTSIGKELGFWYTVQPEEGGPYEAAEYNLIRVEDAFDPEAVR